MEDRLEMKKRCLRRKILRRIKNSNRWITDSFKSSNHTVTDESISDALEPVVDCRNVILNKRERYVHF